MILFKIIIMKQTNYSENYVRYTIPACHFNVNGSVITPPPQALYVQPRPKSVSLSTLSEKIDLAFSQFQKQLVLGDYCEFRFEYKQGRLTASLCDSFSDDIGSLTCSSDDKVWLPGGVSVSTSTSMSWDSWFLTVLGDKDLMDTSIPPTVAISVPLVSGGEEVRMFRLENGVEHHFSNLISSRRMDSELIDLGLTLLRDNACELVPMICSIIPPIGGGTYPCFMTKMPVDSTIIKSLSAKAGERIFIIGS